MGNRARPILVIDDNAATRYATSRVLRDAGYFVVEAESGAKGLELAHQTPGLLLLDVHLPDISGFEVCKRFRSFEHCASVPVIHISATSITDEDKVAGLESGADAYLTHPIDPAVLVATVKAFLRARRAEEARSESDAKFRAIFDQGKALAIILELDGSLSEINRSTLESSGIERGELIGQKVWDVPWWKDKDASTRIQSAFNDCLGGDSQFLELQFLPSIGQSRTVDFQVSAVYNQDNELVHVAMVGIDVTDRRQTERENAVLFAAMKEADTKKDEFLATLAHELRNPLAPILAGIQLLSDEASSGQNSEILLIMNRQLTHLIRLVDDLLDVSRISLGKISLVIETVSLRSVLESAIETSSPAIAAKKHSFHADLPNEDLFVECDPVRLSQVFSNLLNNAAKYTHPGGRIKLSTKFVDDSVEVMVRDDGIGIASDQLVSVFDAFNQIPESRGAAAGGLGIGLTFAKSLVALHNGRIHLESQGAGKGTSAIVTLPVTEHLAGRGESSGAVLPAPSRRLRVLVVDDAVDNAQMMSTLLTTLGHDVRMALTGIDAIQSAQEFRPHLAFIDIGLPDMMGRDVAVAIRERLGDTIHLVALSGYGTTRDRDLSLAAGFARHLTKPASKLEVEEVISSVPVERRG